MKKLTDPNSIFPPRKIVPPPPKAKRRFNAKVVTFTGAESLPSVFARAQGKRSALVCTGAEVADVPDIGVDYAARIRVDIESYYRFQKRSIHFIFVVPKEGAAGALADYLTEAGSVLLKDQNDTYYDEAIADSVKRNDFFFRPQFNAESVKRLAVANLDSLENFYIKDLVVQEL